MSLNLTITEDNYIRSDYKEMSNQNLSRELSQQKSHKRSMSAVDSSFNSKQPTLYHSETEPRMYTSMSQTVSSPQHSSKTNWATKYEDFEIGKPIGYGSSAIVYGAIHKPTQRKTAIKMIDLDMFERNQIDELRRETTLMALSKHPNVLRVYGSFVNGSKLYIVTPYLTAGSCLDIMKTTFPQGLDEISIATILRQTLEGLIYLHKNSHIHRDVKAGNLLMDDQGTVLLADFGVSSSLTDNRDVRKTFVGTPCWMAPEVMEQKGYNYKADIWSFGITALELATGHAPFSKYPPMKVLMMTLSNAPPTLDRERGKHKYSKAFKEMIDSCLQKDPSKRPTAEKLITHSFFKQAKKKEYLIKSILQFVLPLDQRPRKRIPEQHVSVETTEQWDFDDQSDSQDPSSTNDITAAVVNKPTPSITNAVVNNPSQTTVTPVIITPARSLAPPIVQTPIIATAIASSSSTSSTPSVVPERSKPVIQFDECPKPIHVNKLISSSIVDSSSTPNTKKHISFGEAVIKEPVRSLSTVESPFIDGPSPMLDYNPTSKKSRFVIEDPSSNDTVTSLDPVIGLGIQPATPSTGSPEGEIKKGRFSLNQRPTTLDDLDKPEPTKPTPDPEQKKSRFEVNSESVPVTRENSSQSRESSLKISRFSIEKPDCCDVPPLPPLPAPATPPECRKKGRFELTGGSSDQSQFVDSPQTILTGVGQSPMISPCNSLSRGQGVRLLDSSMTHMMYHQLDCIMKQNEVQKNMIQELLSTMQTPSTATPALTPRARTISDAAKGSITLLDDESQRVTNTNLSTDIYSTVEHLQQLLLNSNKEKDKLMRENELLKREIEKLRKSNVKDQD